MVLAIMNMIMVYHLLERVNFKRVPLIIVTLSFVVEQWWVLQMAFLWMAWSNGFAP